jgi:hypothetical protein
MWVFPTVELEKNDRVFLFPVFVETNTVMCSGFSAAYDHIRFESPNRKIMY